MSWIGSLAAKVAARLDDRDPVFYAADVTLFAMHEGVWHVLLIERGWAPDKGKLALPGGHVDAGESSEQAARREAAEETGLDLSGVVLDRIGVYDAPGRDARGRYVSVAYGAVLEDAIAPVAGDDAASAAWMPLPTAARVAHRGGFAFDHADILFDAARRYGFGPDSPGSWDLWS
ncbi:DNA hydrolase [Amycolatopsis mediterranei S699]|uniref:DNA hydrolase n=5 Tax=Amycolatopsis mediterranei TaxID=33910 RepID=A0A0H3CV65_AMYMU|nr:NUDIX hydrolase [Amycolatopsis mediterranei]ABX56690.1 NUDIX hydrolase [Amycolatopsis mediterranei]ADJ42193.1 DNA hydrolase [Amycolatopsis mediterranei U32]AFO73907.1 DNA hydrolase [Amycolatopsis mediterranei S699]AGT81036.1 DNA hydrolase [Amycolatopsis mediterranei RB]KDU86641.1 DNA hydrolase [Amycolatopsis mediterranei]